MERNQEIQRNSKPLKVSIKKNHKNIDTASPQFLGVGSVPAQIFEDGGYPPVGEVNLEAQYTYNDHAFVYKHNYDQKQYDNFKKIKDLYFA